MEMTIPPGWEALNLPSAFFRCDQCIHLLVDGKPEVCRKCRSYDNIHGAARAEKYHNGKGGEAAWRCQPCKGAGRTCTYNAAIKQLQEMLAASNSPSSAKRKRTAASTPSSVPPTISPATSQPQVSTRHRVPVFQFGNIDRFKGVWSVIDKTSTSTFPNTISGRATPIRSTAHDLQTPAPPWNPFPAHDLSADLANHDKGLLGLLPMLGQVEATPDGSYALSTSPSSAIFGETPPPSRTSMRHRRRLVSPLRAGHQQATTGSALADASIFSAALSSGQYPGVRNLFAEASEFYGFTDAAPSMTAASSADRYDILRTPETPLSPKKHDEVDLSESVGQKWLGAVTGKLNYAGTLDYPMPTRPPSPRDANGRSSPVTQDPLGQTSTHPGTNLPHDAEAETKRMLIKNITLKLEMYQDDPYRCFSNGWLRGEMTRLAEIYRSNPRGSRDAFMQDHLKDVATRFEQSSLLPGMANLRPTHPAFKEFFEYESDVDRCNAWRSTLGRKMKLQARDANYTCLETLDRGDPASAIWLRLGMASAYMHHGRTDPAWAEHARLDALKLLKESPDLGHHAEELLGIMAEDGLTTPTLAFNRLKSVLISSGPSTG